MYAEIIPILRLPRSKGAFDYGVPDDMISELKPGCIVAMPFRGRKRQGLVMRIKKTTDVPVSVIKPIEPLLTDNPVPEHVTEQILALSRSFALSPVSTAKAFLPDIPWRKHKTPHDHDSQSQWPAVTISKAEAERIGSLAEALPKDKHCFAQSSKYANKLAFIIKVIRETVPQRQVLLLFAQHADLERAHHHLSRIFQDTAVVHGQLAKNAYFNAWQQINNGEARIILGTRQAVLAPAHELGAIIVDQDSSDEFKQADQTPRYDARRVAESICGKTGARLIMTGHAPRLSAFSLGKSGSLKKIDLDGPDPSAARVIDMNHAWRKQVVGPLSEDLQQEIDSSIKGGKACLLFLNRRGDLRMSRCKDRGFQSNCPDCGVPLVLPSSERSLICYACDHKQPVPLSCPGCSSANIRSFGYGTRSVESAAHQAFPQARIARIDSDVTETQDLKTADIVVATRLILSNTPDKLALINRLGLAAVISMDTALFRPDFSSLERAFLLGSEVFALASENDASRLLQTHYPDHALMRALASHDYDALYEDELQSRKQMGYPPFMRITKLIYRHPNSKKAAYETATLMKELQKIKKDVIIEESMQSLPSKGRAVHHIIIKSDPSDEREIEGILRQIPETWRIDRDPLSLFDQAYG